MGNDQHTTTVVTTCKTIDQLRHLAKQHHLELDIGIPHSLFFDVVDRLGLRLRDDRAAYAGRLPCAYYDNVKLTPAFIKETPRWNP